MAMVVPETMAGVPQRKSLRGGEAGYTLVAVLAAMTILMLAITAAAPGIQQQVTREKEKEAIFRGEEVAEAIQRYIDTYKRPPTSIDQLLEGLPEGTKKLQILRSEAAHDPLSSTGEWRLISFNDPEMLEFARSVALYNGGQLPPPSDTNLQLFTPQLTGLTNLKTDDNPTSGEDDSTTTIKSFVGVASRNRRPSVLTYYGIERHDKWIFTPLFR